MPQGGLSELAAGQVSRQCDRQLQLRKLPQRHHCQRQVEWSPLNNSGLRELPQIHHDLGRYQSEPQRVQFGHQLCELPQRSERYGQDRQPRLDHSQLHFMP